MRIGSPQHVVPDPAPNDPQTLAQETPERLIQLLAHDDQRVRLEAEFALAAKREVDLLSSASHDSHERFVRLHAAWALGQVARRHAIDPTTLTRLFQDADDEVRAQAAKTLADFSDLPTVRRALFPLLRDANPRVRFFAAQTLSHCMDLEAVDEVLAMLAANHEGDPYLRHAGVMALTRWGDAEALMKRIGVGSSRESRLGVLLALRRLNDPLIAIFLDDSDPQLALEAARANHDENIGSVMRRGARPYSAHATIWHAIAAIALTRRELRLDRAFRASARRNRERICSRRSSTRTRR